MTIPALLKSCERRSGASAAAIQTVEEELGRSLPPDYRAFLLESDGTEGFINDEHYLALWATVDLPSLNTAYAVEEFAPGLTLLGTDGADTGYGFTEVDGRWKYVAVPLVGMGLDAVSSMGATFMELLEQISVSE